MFYRKLINCKIGLLEWLKILHHLLETFYPLSLIFPLFPYQTIHYLYFLFSQFWRKKVGICLIYIVIFFIVGKCHFTQSLFILISWILFKWPKRNLLMDTFFFFFCFPCTKDQLMVALMVTLVGDCIICLDPKVLQNSKYFFTSDKILLVPFTMFLLFCLINVPFSWKLIFKSPSICHSSFKIFSVFKLSDNVSRNLNWSGGLYIIPKVIGFVSG